MIQDTITTPNGGSVTSKTYIVKDYNVVSFRLEVSGAALTDFAIEQQFSPDTPFEPYLSGAGWAGTDTSIIKVSPNAPNTLAAGSPSWAHIRLWGMYAIRFKATSAGVATLKINGNATINR